MRNLIIAVRRLVLRPSFAVPAVATLAVGVGAATAIFSAVNAALLRPLPYPEPGDLYSLRTARLDGAWSSGFVSNAALAAIAESTPSVLGVAGTGTAGTDVLLTDDGRNRRVAIRVVTDGFFDVAGAPLALGAGGALEAREGSYGAVVLSHRIWDQVYARDPDIVGVTLRFPSGTATVVGVAPPDFDLPAATDIWEVFAPGRTSDAELYTGLVRVRPGTTGDALRSELGAMMNGRVADGLDAGDRAFVVVPLIDEIVGDLEPILWIMLGASVVLLALGCVNVAALILARGSAQTRELAIRKALGASHASVTRLLLTEALLLSSLGTSVGLALGYGGIRALSTLGVDSLPRLESVTLDSNVLVGAVLVLGVTTTLVGLLPVLRLARLNVLGLLGQGGRWATRPRESGRLLSGIVVTEIAMALVLVTSAGWLVRSYVNLTETDPGFDPRSRLVFQTMLIGTSYLPVETVLHNENGPYLRERPGGDTPETWLRDLSSRLEELEEFRGVGLASVMPFGSRPTGFQYVSVPGVDDDPADPRLTSFRFVSPGYFEAMGVPVLAGRVLESSDPRTTVVVNEAFVREHLGDRDPVGTTFALGSQPGVFTSERTIVGVVADVRYGSLRERDGPAYYLSDHLANGFVVVSTSLADPTPLIPAVRAAIDDLVPGFPVTIEPLEGVVAEEMARYRLGLVLMTLFAAVSLLLAGIGIHGVVGHGTSLRSTEFAVRIAVGARPAVIAGSVLKQGGILWLLGMSIGITLAYVVGRFGSSRLYEVSASDPAILGGAVSAVSALVLAAFALAAVRGSRVEPGRALRIE